MYVCMYVYMYVYVRMYIYICLYIIYIYIYDEQIIKQRLKFSSKNCRHSTPDESAAA